MIRTPSVRSPIGEAHVLPDAVVQSSTSAAPVGSAASALEGQYYGYITSDRTQALQLVALTLKKREDNTHDGVASLYFGEGDSPELVAYRLSSATLDEGMKMLLDGEGDAFAVLDPPNPRELANAPALAPLHGTWFSKSYGRIGRVILQRNVVPERPQGSALVSPLSGIYQSQTWTFEIAATSGVADSSDEIFPLRFYGWAQENLMTSRKRMIQTGIYDHILGTLALRLDDGRVAYGQRRPDGALDLVWPTKPRASDALIPDLAQRFERIEMQGDRQARLGIP
jgi:hypothetical protein